MINYSNNISLECPYCDTKCQFIQLNKSHFFCKADKLHHISYLCTNCSGIITTKWKGSTDNVAAFESSGHSQLLNIYYPIVGDWKPRVNLSLIKDEIRLDYKEAIDCYNNGFYNACMIMARRAIQQEVMNKSTKGTNLYDQIESTGISNKLKSLLHKVKNFGNNGAHPDFCLFDSNGDELKDKKEFAKLSLEFLDRYFSDEYEIDYLVDSAPKSQKEINSN